MNAVTCAWELITDSMKNPEIVMPDELIALYHFIRDEAEFVGSNTELTEKIGKEISPKGLKQMMNRWRFQLEALGVYFQSKRSNGQKYVVVKYLPDLPCGASSASSDSVSSALEESVPFVPCVPEKEGEI